MRCCTPDVDLAATFCERASEVGMHVVRTTSGICTERVAELVGNVATRLGIAHPKLIIDLQLAERAALCATLADRATVLDPHDGDDALFAADIGITSVEAAVAETGSLVSVSGQEGWRSTSLLPVVHIAIVRAAQIVPDLYDLFESRLPKRIPTAITLISGPSKTADIEGILITGVHGPREVYVIVVDK